METTFHIVVSETCVDKIDRILDFHGTAEECKKELVKLAQFKAKKVDKAEKVDKAKKVDKKK